MMVRSIVFVLCVISLVGLSCPVRAGLFDDDEARRQITKLSTQFDRLQQEIDQQKVKLSSLEATQHRLIDIINQINQIKQDLDQLRGQIEVIEHHQDAWAKRQQNDADLDHRLRALEQTSLNQKMSEQAQEQAHEQGQLDAAIALVKSGKYKSGATALSRFIKDHPEHQERPTAHYWLGTAYASIKEYKQAASSFQYIIKNAPQSPRVPESLLGLASLAASQGDKKTSRRYLIEILEKYPRSEAATTAKKALTIAN